MAYLSSYTYSSVGVRQYNLFIKPTIRISHFCRMRCTSAYQLYKTDCTLLTIIYSAMKLNYSELTSRWTRSRTVPPWDHHGIALATTVPTVGRPTVIKIREPASASDSVPAALWRPVLLYDLSPGLRARRYNGLNRANSFAASAASSFVVLSWRPG